MFKYLKQLASLVAMIAVVFAFTTETMAAKKSKTLKKETAKKKSDKIEKSKKTEEKNSLKEEKGEIVKETNYSSNSIEDLVKIYQELSTSEAWLKNHKSLQSVNHQFNIKFQLEIDEQKKKFLGEGGTPPYCMRFENDPTKFVVGSTSFPRESIRSNDAFILRACKRVSFSHARASHPSAAR